MSLTSPLNSNSFNYISVVFDTDLKVKIQGEIMNLNYFKHYDSKGRIGFTENMIDNKDEIYSLLDKCGKKEIYLIFKICGI